MSASRLKSTIAIDVIASHAMIGYGSASLSAVMKYRPMPSSEKMVSVMMAPPRRPPKLSAITVTSGIRALRKPCFMITVRSGRPFARAVRT
jgi:hypothetical protein